MKQQRKENDSRIYFTINLHGSMAPGRGRTCDPWTASQTRILGHTAVVKMSGNILGRTAQSLKYLVADMCLTADPEFASLIPARSHTFREIADHGILISTTILSLPLI